MSHSLMVVGYNMLRWTGNINAMIWSKCVYVRQAADVMANY